MALAPIAQISTTYEQYPNYWLKGYAQGTTTPISMATDSTGDTLLAKAEVSGGGTVDIGFIKTTGDAIFIPYYDEAYDLFLFPTEAEADANDTSNAIQVADDMGFLSNLANQVGEISVADMVANTALIVGDIVKTDSYSTPGDGGDNSYEVVGAGTGTDDGGSFIDLDNGLQAKGLFPQSIISVKAFGAVGDGAADDTVAIQAVIDFVSTQTTKLIVFPSGNSFALTGCSINTSDISVDARGARFILTSDSSVCFNLNSGAIATDIEGSSSSFIYWQGGVFISTLANPTDAAAFQVYAVRQCVIRDTVIGHAAAIRFTEGIRFAGLGGHLFEKNRFVHVDKGFSVPEWANDAVVASNPVTTSQFLGNEFTTTTGQQAFDVLGGFNRWLIQGGFINGSQNATSMHFTNKWDSTACRISSVWFEQAKQDSTFIHFEDTDGTSMANIKLDTVTMDGDPAGSGFTDVKLERCKDVDIENCRFEGTTAAGNNSLDIDVNCSNIEISKSTEFSGAAGIVFLCPRTEILFGATFTGAANIVLTNFNASSHSTSTLTLDMEAEVGAARYPLMDPTGYTLLIQARDLESATTGNTRVEVFTTGGGTPDPATRRAMIYLDNVPDDVRIGQTIDVLADENGDIALDISASGVDTLDLWIYVVSIWN